MNFLLAVITAACFGLWPLVMKYASVSPAWSAVYISCVTFVMSLTVLISTSSEKTIFSLKIILIGLAAGALNGIGTLLYTRLIASPSTDISKIAPLIVALMPLFTIVGALILFGEPITLKKGCALVLIAVVAWLLK
ncbi:MAG: EamA family transporter [Parcubacteria group bacterium]|nr:EamA family transporter [Parcubacteria group bacterium]